MKICFLAHNPTEDTCYGIDRYSYELIKHAREHFETLVISQGRLANRRDWVVKEFTYPWKLLGVKADIYHALSQVHAKAALIVNKHPLVTTIHDLIPFEGSLTSFYYRRDKSFSSFLNHEYMKFCMKVARKSDLIIVPFEITKKDLEKTLAINGDKVRVVPLYGVNTSSFRPLEEIGNIRSKMNITRKRIILFIGGASKAKGCDVLMKAFKTVVKEIPECELWIGGKWSLFDAEKLARELEISPYVNFLGYIPEEKLPIYYNLCELFVFPSRIGFCLQILEAMACRKPVITSDTEDIEEIVGDAVLHASPCDPAELAQAILHVMNDNEALERLAHKGYQKALGLSLDLVIRKTLDFYRLIG